MSSHSPSHASSQEIRSRLDHPVIDADGHIIEFLPAVRDFLVEEGGRKLAEEFDQVVDAGRRLESLSIDERRAMGVFKLTWWPYRKYATALSQSRQSSSGTTEQKA